METERLILRDFTIVDVEAVHDYVSNPDVSKYEPWESTSKSTTREYLERVISFGKQDPQLVL